jgi:hypothetical protein
VSGTIGIKDIFLLITECHRKFTNDDFYRNGLDCAGIGKEVKAKRVGILTEEGWTNECRLVCG